MLWLSARETFRSLLSGILNRTWLRWVEFYEISAVNEDGGERLEDE